MNKIPQNRALLYILTLALLPVLLSSAFVMSRLKTLDNLNQEFESLKETLLFKDQRQASNKKVRAYFKDADHFYIDKELETLSFLEPEIEVLQKIVSQKNFPDDEGIKKRLEFLKGSGNDLVFNEGVVQNYGPFQEVLETQAHAVEINLSDLKKILSRIEGIEIADNEILHNRPQLLILDLKLDKKTSPDKNETYQLSMKLLKREFAP